MNTTPLYSMNMHNKAKSCKKTDETIITMHTLFLTPGFHTITFESREKIDSILKNFLSTMIYYHTIGCITTQDTLFDPHITHIYHELLYGGYLDSDLDCGLDDFITQRWYFDFIWIEGYKILTQEAWFIALEKKIHYYAIEKNIPLIICMTP